MAGGRFERHREGDRARAALEIAWQEHGLALVGRGLPRLVSQRKAGWIDETWRSLALSQNACPPDVTVAAPLTAETKGMIGEAAFASMKPDAVVINVGRGPVIDEAAMVKALRENRIKGAALDVFDREPLPDGHPLYSLQNVLLSPHCADHTPDWMDRAMQFFLDQFERFVKGEPLMNIVDKKLGY